MINNHKGKGMEKEKLTKNVIVIAQLKDGDTLIIILPLDKKKCSGKLRDMINNHKGEKGWKKKN